MTLAASATTSLTISTGGTGITNNNVVGAGLTLGAGSNITINTTGGSLTNNGKISNDGTITVN